MAMPIEEVNDAITFEQSFLAKSKIKKPSKYRASSVIQGLDSKDQHSSSYIEWNKTDIQTDKQTTVTQLRILKIDLNSYPIVDTYQSISGCW